MFQESREGKKTDMWHAQVEFLSNMDWKLTLVLNSNEMQASLQIKKENVFYNLHILQLYTSLHYSIQDVSNSSFWAKFEL